MNPEHMMRLEQFWSRAYEYYSEQLPPHKTCWFAHDTKAYDPDALELAFEAYRMDPARLTAYKPRPPLPGDLIALLSKNVAPEHRANEAANAIYSAMQTVGYNKPAEARTRLGDLGWAVVQSMGGWESLCQGTLTARRENFVAQARDQALSVLARQKADHMAIDVPHVIAGRDPKGVLARGPMASIGAISERLLQGNRVHPEAARRTAP